MKYEISHFRSEDEYEWDHFINNHSDSTIFHTIGWKKVIESTFGYAPEYLLGRDDNGKIVGISPAFKVRTLFGKVIISQPFFEYGGMIVENGHDELYKDFLNYYKHQADHKKIHHMEIKILPGVADANYIDNGYIKQCYALGFILDVRGKSYDNFWQGVYDNKLRNSIRKGIKVGIGVKEETRIDNYYDLYLTTMEKLGSPPYPKAFFDNIVKYLENLTRFTFAFLDETPIASLWSFKFKNRISIVGNVSRPDYKQYNCNDILYDEQVKYAIDNHYDLIDFGRTRPDSPYEQYKKKWGAMREDLSSYVYPDKGHNDINPYKYYMLFSSITRKVPWILTRTGIGPYIVKRFP